LSGKKNKNYTKNNKQKHYVQTCKIVNALLNEGSLDPTCHLKYLSCVLLGLQRDEVTRLNVTLKYNLSNFNQKQYIIVHFQNLKCTTLLTVKK
jgi:hypothetical protein